MASSPKPKRVTKAVKTGLVLPDPHFGFRRSLGPNKPLDPFHDRAALDIASQIAQSYHFDRVTWLGDILDLPDWSDKFTRSPEMFFTTQPALIEAAFWISEIKFNASDADHEVLEGNHDLRLELAMQKHLMTGYGLKSVDNLHLPSVMSVPYLLSLHNLDIEWVGGYPDNRVWYNEQLALEHGAVAKAVPGATAAEINKKRTYSTIFGHIHRGEYSTRLVRSRDEHRMIYAMSPGFLGRVDGTVPGHKPETQEWNQGLAIVHYTDDGYSSVVHVPIDHGVAMYDDTVWIARDRMEDIRGFTDDDWGF